MDDTNITSRISDVPDLKPTRHELIQLVKYWATVVLEIQYYFFLFEQAGSYEWRLGAFAQDRICLIETALGEEEVQEAVEQAEREFSKGIDSRYWAMFKGGTKEEREAFREEINRLMFT